MVKDKIEELVVPLSYTLMDAMKHMDRVKKKILFLFDGENFVSILTIGDIQRAIIGGKALDDSVTSIPSTNKIYATPSESMASVHNKMARLRAEYMPVIDAEGRLVDVILWRDVVQEESEPERDAINLPVVIMAGGLGTRLKPITNVIPKPLIPIGEKTIIEAIMDQFQGIGCRKFYISVNYKSNILRYYLDQLPEHYDVEYIEEDKPLGTIGSVSLLRGRIDTPFFVSNCDALISQDYRDVYEYHQNSRNDITIVTALKSYAIPYGVIETTEGGILTGIKEKPQLAYQINTGVYVLNPEMIDEIPDGQFFHITDLFERVRANDGRIGCFPVSDGSWVDIGEWDKYLQLIDVR